MKRVIFGVEMCYFPAKKGIFGKEVQNFWGEWCYFIGENVIFLFEKWYFLEEKA